MKINYSGLRLVINNKTILLWGYTRTYYSANRFDVIFPITFSSLDYCIVASVKDVVYHYGIVAIIAYSQTGCTFSEAEGMAGMSRPINYFAIGY